ncbi:hypothetical protein K9N68_08795 [Kovacikia minuta CCNUW1]|uniref:hypothetical protein n=1 Tax=Kovacikia minuta TaxID=2931930 RepID=UPI001CCBCE16|nr:hypothetical protein [Kovacikia minuta]UBF27975.1 hypothetical protein K9N68_08795 [Kovacikia minuta CCNUW1]
MTQYTSSFVAGSQKGALPRNQKQLLKAFWIFTPCLVLYEIYLTKTDSLLSNFGAVLITVAALIPFYLWSAGKALGMPIFPFFAITFIWTYALPLVSNHPVVETYPAHSQFFAAVTVAGFLLIGTFTWFQFVRTVPPPPQYYWSLGKHKGDRFFFAALIGSTMFYLLSTNGVLSSLPVGIYAAVRSALLGLSALSTFILSYRLGRGELTKKQSWFFIFILIDNMIVSSMNFLLIGAASTFLVSTVAFIIGRRKIPIIPIVIAVVILTILHAGKADMRNKYWFNPDTPKLVQVWNYPEIYAEWINFSMTNLFNQNKTQETEKRASFFERASVIHMLLLAQTKSPDPIPFLYGKTYETIPQVIIPRLINPNRIRSQEGTHMLSVHYGLQTAEATKITSISWGLVAESYANFGIFGCVGLAIIMGSVHGQFTRWSISAPTLSLQSLFTVLMLTFALQTEWTAGTFIAAFSQSSTVLFLIAILFMKMYWSHSFPVVNRQ